MSSASTPIPLHRFAEAIRDLPLSNLHLKVAELQNSIAHLESSNQQLKPCAEDGDQECVDALAENNEVIARMKERTALLKEEVERRGHVWEEERGGNKSRMNEHIEEDVSRDLEPRQESNQQEIRQHGGSLSDGELAVRLQEQLRQGSDEENTVGIDDGDGGGLYL